MCILPIRIVPDSVLWQKSEEIVNIDGKLIKFVKDMVATMYNAPGLGLAANQLGYLYRIITLNSRCFNLPEVIINPFIKESEGEICVKEGCLSIPRVIVEMERHARVYVTGINTIGSPISTEAKGFDAAVLQHEIDHLDGILIIDY
jgi:peptide deformylase